MHCNLNTADLASASALYVDTLGLTERMHSVSTGSDGTMMGLGPHTESVTSFLYDHRGPRAAPALELVDWHVPALAPAADPTAVGFTSIGLRTSSLAATIGTLRAAGHEVAELRGGVAVRGRTRAAARFTDPDGVTVELVEIDADAGVALSHERVRCSDLDASLTWFTRIGWQILDRSDATASLSLPEDPTFSLEFEQQQDAPRAQRTAATQGLYRIALAVEDVTEAQRSLNELVPIPEPVFIPMPDVPTGGFTVLFMADPDGLVVEFVDRPRSAVRRPSTPI